MQENRRGFVVLARDPILTVPLYLGWASTREEAEDLVRTQSLLAGLSPELCEVQDLDAQVLEAEFSLLGMEDLPPLKDAGMTRVSRGGIRFPDAYEEKASQ